jgi:GNAT superfamily N-acetyltransferase
VLSARELRDTYDRHVRAAQETRPADGVVCDWDGPLLRCTGGHRGFVSYRDLAGVAGADLDALIERTCQHYRAIGASFEWKTHSHDEPADLTERLLRAGFVAEDTETVVIGEVARIAADPVLPPGITLSAVVSERDLRRIAETKSEIYDEDWTWLADDLAARLRADPDSLTVLLAEAPGTADAGRVVVSSAWIVFNPDGRFAGLWGGSTASVWRGQGIYRAMVARRAQLAAERGYEYLQVDALETSRPILERLGFVAVTTTTPYIWKPAAQPVDDAER